MLRKKLRNFVSAVAIFSLAGFVAVPFAQADDDTDKLVDGTRSVSLTVHKYRGANFSPKLPNDGSAVTDANRNEDKLNGVQFDVYQVNVDGEPGDKAKGTARPLDFSKDADQKLAYKLYSTPTNEGGLGSSYPTATQIKNGVTIGDVKFTFVQISVPDNSRTANGEVTFNKDNTNNKLVVGYYLVKENLKGSGTITAGTSGEEIKKAQISESLPFFVSLPMTQDVTTAGTPDPVTTPRSGWRYDVHVYPKNFVDTIVKKVNDENATNGVTKDISYRIETSISPVSEDLNHDGTADGKDIGAYYIQDILDSRLDPGTVKWKLVIKKDQALADGTADNEVALLEDTDYKVKTIPITTGTNKGKSLTYVNFKTAGLQKLFDAVNGGAPAPNAKVISTLKVKWKDTGTEIGDGIINNTAQFVPNDSSWRQDPPTGNDPNTPVLPDPDQPEPPTPPTGTDDKPKVPFIESDTVTSKYGEAVIKKINPSNEALDGAEFKLYTSGDDATCTRDDAVEANYVGTFAPANDKIQGQTKGVYSITKILLSTEYTHMDANGVVTKKEVKDQVDPTRAYCVVETKAPENYILLAEPVKIEVSNAGGATAIGETITNLPDTFANRLPFTGASGILIMLVAGGLLVTGALLILARYRREEEEEA